MTTSEARQARGLPADTTLGAVADAAFDRIAALVRTVLAVPIGLVSLVDRQGQVFPGQSGLPAPWAETRRTALSHSLCQHIVRTTEPLILTDARREPGLTDSLAIADMGVIAYAGMPLVDLDGTVVGSLCAIDTEPHEWSPSEICLLADLAALCSAELQLRQAASAAADAQDRMSTLLQLSEALADTTTTSDVSLAVSTLAAGRLGATFGGITVLDADRERLTYVDMSTLPPKVGSAYRTFALTRHTPSTAAVRSGRPVYHGTLEEMADDYPQAAPALVAAGAQACAYLPLRVRDQVIGTLGIIWDHPRSFDAADRALLDALARYTAQAVARALLLADQRQVAETLQTSLLPTLPDVDWLDLCATYLPAHVTNAVGGDWFDAFAPADGSLVVSVGDVQGHDMQAAAAMGQLRSALRGLVIGVPGTPAQVLSSLDSLLAQLPVGRFATGILGTLSRIDGGARFCWSNAGHFAPLLMTPGAPARYLDTAAELPLGLPLPAPSRSAHTIDLGAGSLLLMFTDGLVDRRDTELEELLDCLRTSVERHSALPLAQLIEAVLADLGATEHDDDIVVLGLRLPG